MCAWGNVHVCAGTLGGQSVGCWGAWVTGGWLQPVAGAGDWTWVLWKSSRCSELLCHLSTSSQCLLKCFLAFYILCVWRMDVQISVDFVFYWIRIVLCILFIGAEHLWNMCFIIFFAKFCQENIQVLYSFKFKIWRTYSCPNKMVHASGTVYNHGRVRRDIKRKFRD